MNHFSIVCVFAVLAPALAACSAAPEEGQDDSQSSAVTSGATQLFDCQDDKREGHWAHLELSSGGRWLTGQIGGGKLQHFRVRRAYELNNLSIEEDTTGQQEADFGEVRFGPDIDPKKG